MAFGTIVAFGILIACFAFVLSVIKMRQPSAGVILYSAEHYGGTRAVLTPGTAAPPFQPQSIFVPLGLQAVLLLTPGVNRVTVSPGSSVSVFTDVQPGTTVTSVTVTAAASST